MDRTLQDRQIPARPSLAIDAGHAPDPARPAVVRRAGTRAGVRWDLPRLSSAELIAAGVSAELLASLALRRAFTGRLAKSGAHYYDNGFPIASFLTQTLDALTDGGFLTLSEEVSGMRRLHLTDAGQTRYSQLTARPQR